MKQLYFKNKIIHIDYGRDVYGGYVFEIRYDNSFWFHIEPDRMLKILNPETSYDFIQCKIHTDFLQLIIHYIKDNKYVFEFKHLNDGKQTRKINLNKKEFILLYKMLKHIEKIYYE